MDQDAQAWRQGLQAKGRDWVLRELQTRPGLPDDVLYDVVYTAPFPTRAFCWQWCIEQDNRMFQFAGSTKVALIALVLLVIFIASAVQFWDANREVQATRNSVAARAGRH